MIDGVSAAVAGLNGGATYFLSRLIFLRFLGLICPVAFISFWVQCVALVGGNGIMPARHFMRAVAEYAGPSGWWRVPSLFWLNCSDGAIRGACVSGAVCSHLLAWAEPDRCDRHTRAQKH
jgi:hypothetical protein